MEKRVCSPGRTGQCRSLGTKYRLDAGVRISTIDTRPINQTAAPAAKSAVA